MSGMVAFPVCCFGNVSVLILEAKTWASIGGSASHHWMSFCFLTWKVGIIIPCLQGSQNSVEQFQYSPKLLLSRKGFCGQVGLGNPALKRAGFFSVEFLRAFMVLMYTGKFPGKG